MSAQQRKRRCLRPRPTYGNRPASASSQTQSRVTLNQAQTSPTVRNSSSYSAAWTPLHGWLGEAHPVSGHRGLSGVKTSRCTCTVGPACGWAGSRVISARSAWPRPVTAMRCPVGSAGHGTRGAGGWVGALSRAERRDWAASAEASGPLVASKNRRIPATGVLPERLAAGRRIPPGTGAYRGLARVSSCIANHIDRFLAVCALPPIGTTCPPSQRPFG